MDSATHDTEGDTMNQYKISMDDWTETMTAADAADAIKMATETARDGAYLYAGDVEVRVTGPDCDVVFSVAVEANA